MASQSTKKRQTVVRKHFFSRMQLYCSLFGPFRTLVVDLTLSAQNASLSVQSVGIPWNRLNAAYLSKSRDIIGWCRIIEPQSSGVPHIHAFMFTKSPVARMAYA